MIDLEADFLEHFAVHRILDRFAGFQKTGQRAEAIGEPGGMTCQ